MPVVETVTREKRASTRARHNRACVLFDKYAGCKRVIFYERPNPALVQNIPVPREGEVVWVLASRVCGTKAKAVPHPALLSVAEVNLRNALAGVSPGPDAAEDPRFMLRPPKASDDNPMRKVCYTYRDADRYRWWIEVWESGCVRRSDDVNKVWHYEVRRETMDGVVCVYGASLEGQLDAPPALADVLLDFNRYVAGVVVGFAQYASRGVVGEYV